MSTPPNCRYTYYVKKVLASAIVCAYIRSTLPDVRMARVSIYVPDDLKERMDRLGDRENWSSCAQQAFKRVVASKEWKNMTDELERAVARLRQSKEKYEEQEDQSGKKHGRRWALNNAAYGELASLERA